MIYKFYEKEYVLSINKVGIRYIRGLSLLSNGKVIYVPIEKAEEGIKLDINENIVYVQCMDEFSAVRLIDTIWSTLNSISKKIMKFFFDSSFYKRYYTEYKSEIDKIESFPYMEFCSLTDMIDAIKYCEGFIYSLDVYFDASPIYIKVISEIDNIYTKVSRENLNILFDDSFLIN